MGKIKKANIFILIVLLLASCTDDDVTFDIDLGEDIILEIPLSIDTLMNFDQAGTDTDFHSFSGKLSLDSENRIFDPLREYKGYDVQIFITGVILEIKKSENVSNGSVIKEFRCHAVDSAGTEYIYEKSEMTYDTDFSENAFNSFLNNILNDIQSGKVLELEVSGITDVYSSNKELGTLIIVPEAYAQVDMKETLN